MRNGLTTGHGMAQAAVVVRFKTASFFIEICRNKLETSFTQSHRFYKVI